VDERDWLARRFEEHRPRLRAVAYRMLGSLAEAEDAVQETWLRLSRSDAGAIENLGGWLTTLRSRRTHPAEPLGVHLPDPIVDRADGSDPENQALLADSVGLALLVVLETLTPAERLAYVLHDVFAVPFDQIAPIVERSPEATRQLASRARRRIRGEHTNLDASDADLDAARNGDFEALVAVLHPDVVLRVDLGPLAERAGEVRGAANVAHQALGYREVGLVIRRALVNGAPGAVSTLDGRVFSIGGFTIREGRIVAMDILGDPDRLAQLDLTILDR
jgi:RNA polymerase sigma factor (sigma-70 family)